MEKFRGRVAVVTGASSGIGAQLAEDLVRAGLVVVGVARRRERLEALASSLSGLDGRLEVLQADLSSVDEVKRVFKWIDESLGGVTVLVNNAAICPITPTQDQELGVIESAVATNLTAMMVGSNLAVNNMKRFNIKDGHIININSVAGHKIMYSPGQDASVTTYTTTKHGAVAFSNALRFDSLSPGTVRTEMTSKWVEQLPKDRVLDPKDVSNAALYVLSCPTTVEISELTIQPQGESF
ncbi:hypothetical protein FOCC_FOCC001800 [Frankliniella occidentalis]|nr:hypothetical protein FOCC_FOCC001800 [Frankliniella occidentalis]